MIVRPHRDLVPLAGALSDDDLDGLIPTFVATRADIDLAEQANIEAATRWAFGRRRVADPEQLLTVEFSDRVHQRMFGDVWKWAGRHCTVRTATGVDPHRIEPRLSMVFDDARFWHTNGLDSPSERAVKLCHGLLKVHAYGCGNARHARFMADLYLHIVGVPRLAWSNAHEITSTESRKRSDFSALQQALDRATRSGAPERPRAGGTRRQDPDRNPTGHQ
jgi:Fic-DOC domain mobile mystery protein B